MNITTISASVQKSEQILPGQWVKIELGASADLAPGEDSEKAQTDLYMYLAHQLAVKFPKSKQPTQVQQPGKQESQAATKVKDDVEPGSTCPIHGDKMSEKKNKGGSWWSHKDSNGNWCNGKVKKAA